MRFEVRPPGVREISAGAPAKIAGENARLKARAIAAAPEEVVLGADTVVVLGDWVLGKPESEADAVSILARLSGATHSVLTAVALISARWGAWEKVIETRVRFRRIPSDEISAYCRTSEPYDKAGAYAIQGLGCLFVEAIEGSYTNVVGLPAEAVLEGLAALTGIAPSGWGGG